MIGTTLNKSGIDWKEYRRLANWCNSNNATIEDKGDYYEVVALAPVELATLEEQYSERVAELIRERYSMNDELAILRQRDIKPTEYAEYFLYCEECKATAKAEIYTTEEAAE